MKTFTTPAGWLQDAVQIELIGAGGTGSSMLDELFRLHTLLTRLGHPGLEVRVWDGDTVCEANVGRQRFWPCDVGWNKAEILVERYNGFGGTSWRYEARHFEDSDCDMLMADLIISCVDDPAVRVMIGEAGRRVCPGGRDALWMDTGNDENSGQVILGDWAGWGSRPDALPNVYDLYPTLKGQTNDEQPSCSTEEAVRRQEFGINQRVAAEASGLLWQLMRHGGLDRHGAFVYQDSGEVVPLAISGSVWLSFGLQATDAA